MKLSLLSTLLLAFTLLLGASGCSKKDDPAASTANTASYKLNGVTVTCQATASLASRSAGSQLTSILNILLTDTPQQPSTAQTLILKFEKQDGQPNSAYQLTTIDYVKNGASVLYANQVTTIRETGSYVFSGTFSGTASVQGNQSTITDGVFTDVSL